MEGYTMFLDWKNQYCQNDYTTQGNIQIQCNPYEINNGIFNSMTVAQKQTYRSMEQDRKSRNKPKHLWLFNL